MSSGNIHSYSKVWALGHPQITELCNEPVLVAEKIDGSQFSFRLASGEGQGYVFRSKNCDVHIGDGGMFELACTAISELDLNPNYLYRGEYLAKPHHNALTYGRIPRCHVAIFDIEDMKRGPYHFLPPYVVLEECARLGLDYIHPDEMCMVHSIDDLDTHMKKPSMLGGEREGVVLKNYGRWTVDGKVMMGKYVSEKYKETKGSAWQSANPQKADIVTRIIQGLRTEARYAKAAQHLRERGELTESVQDIGRLIAEVKSDVIAEETDMIKQVLFEWARGQIERGVSGGVPQWWKDVLAARQFSAVESHPTDAPLETWEGEGGSSASTQPSMQDTDIDGGPVHPESWEPASEMGEED